ncbi:MAG: hypothetical protein S4CHLAM37_12930 [Chlamydiia bacterium]|nr:hypothetical protein [Chlamydiia bacterium]
MVLQSTSFTNRFEEAHALFTSTFGSFQETSQSIAGLRVRADQARLNAQADNLREMHPRELHGMAHQINMQAQTLVANKLALTQVIKAVKDAADFTNRNPIDSYTIATIDSLGIIDGLGGKIDKAQKDLPLFRKQLMKDLGKLIQEEATMQKEITGLTKSLDSLQGYIENRGWFQGLISATFKSSPIEAAQFEDAVAPHVPNSLSRDQYELPQAGDIETDDDSAIGSDDGLDTEDGLDTDSDTTDTEADEAPIAQPSKKADTEYVSRVLAEQRQLQKDLDLIMKAATAPPMSTDAETDPEDDVQEVQIIETKTPLRRSERNRAPETDTSDDEASVSDAERAAEFLAQLEASNLVETGDETAPVTLTKKPSRKKKAPAKPATAPLRTSKRTRNTPDRLGFEASKKSPYAELQKELDAITAEYDKTAPSSDAEDSDPEDDIPLAVLFPAAAQRRRIAEQEAANAKVAKKATKKKRSKKAEAPVQEAPATVRRSSRTRAAPSRLGFEVSENSPYKEPMEALKKMVAEKEAEEIQQAAAPKRRSPRKAKATKRAVKEKTPKATAPRRRSPRKATPVVAEEVAPVIQKETPVVTAPKARKKRAKKVATEPSAPTRRGSRVRKAPDRLGF